MDKETIKILLLEKILDVFAPKIIGYYFFLNNEEKGISWIPSFSLLPDHLMNVYDNYSIRIIVHNDLCTGKLNYSFTKTIYGERRDFFRFNDPLTRHRHNNDIIVNEVFEFESNNTKDIIKKIINHVDISYLTKIAANSMKEIEQYENEDNMSIGTIKKILGIHPNIDLQNLDTRKVLTEKI